MENEIIEDLNKQILRHNQNIDKCDLKLRESLGYGYYLYFEQQELNFFQIVEELAKDYVALKKKMDLIKECDLKLREILGYGYYLYFEQQELNFFQIFEELAKDYVALKKKMDLIK